MGIIIYDAYRPVSVSVKMWQSADHRQKRILANPYTTGSVHNRGAAVDLTLYDIKSTKALPMPSDYDEVSVRSRRSWKSYNPERNSNAEKLRSVMEKYGFKSIDNEWWHFEWNNWQSFPEQDWLF